MVVILNGPLGVGKTETAWKLLDFFDRAAILDADYVGSNVRPFDYHNPEAVRAATESLCAFAEHQRDQFGVKDFVVSGVFETPDQLNFANSLLARVAGPVNTYLLMATESNLAMRIRNRNNEEVEREITRAKELRQIMLMASRPDHLGKPIDTSVLSISQTASAIWDDLQSMR